jgi:hypothetical protein
MNGIKLCSRSPLPARLYEHNKAVFSIETANLLAAFLVTAMTMTEAAFAALRAARTEPDVQVSLHPALYAQLSLRAAPMVAMAR